jgi:hypothetical protein
MFVSGAAMVDLMNAAIQPKLPGAFTAVTSVWQPENGQAVVTSTSSGPFTFTVNEISDTVTIQISFRTAFSVTPSHPSMPNNLTTTLSVGAKAEGGVEADLVNDFLAGNFNFPAPDGFRDQGGSFVRDQPVRNLSLLGLGLAVEQAYGDADGMVLAGNLEPARHRDDPEVSVLYKTPFELRYLVSCRSQRDSGKKIVPTADNVLAIGRFLLTGGTGTVPLKVHKFLFVRPGAPGVNGDPLDVFGPLFNPDVLDGSGEIGATIFPNSLPQAYADAPYSCDMIVVTNCGVVFVSLGVAPLPQVDAQGVVTNAKADMIHDCKDKEVTPLTVLVTVLDPHHLVDPGDLDIGEISQEMSRLIAQGARHLDGLESLATLNVRGVQVGSVSMGTIHLFEPASEPDGLARSSARKTNALGASLLTRAVSAQMPAFARGKRKGLRIA